MGGFPQTHGPSSQDRPVVPWEAKSKKRRLGSKEAKRRVAGRGTGAVGLGPCSFLFFFFGVGVGWGGGEGIQEGVRGSFRSCAFLSSFFFGGGEVGGGGGEGLAGLAGQLPLAGGNQRMFG